MECGLFKRLLTAIILTLTFAGCSFKQSATVPTPTMVKLTSMTLVSYTSTVATVNLTGTLPASVISAQSPVQFFTDSTCGGSKVGQGLASDFSGQGVQLLLPVSVTSHIYFSTNTVSGCFYVGDFNFSPGQPLPPVFNSTSPSSPSAVSYEPAIFGTALINSTVNLYTDVNCTQLVGSGSSSDFSSIGVQVTLLPDTTSSIYGEVVDPVGTVSTCSLLTQYQHSSLGPSPPVFLSTNPASPNNLSLTPVLTGTVSTGTVTVSVYGDSACSNLLVSGLATDFTSTGFQLTVTANSLSTLYAQAYDAAGLPSVCSYLTNYLYDNVAPAAPTYSSANPVTPTRLTIYPKISGLSSADTVQMKFFNSILCLVQIGAGSKAEFESTGIIAGVAPNAITPIYAVAVDSAGNNSACTHFVDYLNNTIPPSLPIFGSTTPPSPNNISSNPMIIGIASLETVSLNFFSDSNCTAQMGTGTADDYNGAGILLTTPAIPNSVNITNVFVEAIDAEGNVSECSQLTTYGYSTAKAQPAAFLQSIPKSPSNTSKKPWILGTAPASVSFVRLFNDSSCLQNLGSASRSTFSAMGIQITVNANTSTDLYSLTTDVYGNDSDCTYLTTYVHDNISPLAPSFLASTPISPNNQSTTPLIQGSVVTNIIGKPLTTSVVKFYDNFLCLGQLGHGAPATFTSSGIMIEVPPNVASTVYAQTGDAAGNTSSCTFMLNYTHDTNPPGRPILGSATPMTPSYSRKTIIKGSLASNFDIVASANVNFYRDSSCLNLLGTGLASDYIGSGISLVEDQNQTTTMYGQTIDIVGNLSVCTHLLDFVHSDVPPANLQATQNLDGSVSLGWSPDTLASPNPVYEVKRSRVSGGPYAVLTWNQNGNSYTDYSVSNGKTYYYVVAATNNTGASLDSSEVAITVTATAAQTPTVLQATPGSNLIVLNWNGFQPDMFYKILRATQTGGPYSEFAIDINGTSYTDKSVINGITYYYVVEGKNSSGDSVQSNEASATAMDAPPAPTHLTATLFNSLPACGNNYGVYLAWSGGSYYTSFALRRGTSSGGESDHVITAGNSYLDCVPPGHSITYFLYYQVQGIWGPIQGPMRSPSSNEVSLSDRSGPAVTVSPGNGEVFIRWGSVVNANNYQVWKATVSGWKNPSYVQLDPSFNGTNYQDTSVVNGTAYYYVIISNYSGVISGAPSVEASGVPNINPGPPSNLVITQSIGSASPQLTWSGPANFNNFNIYSAPAFGGPYLYVAPSLVNNFIDSPSSNGTHYYYVTTQWGSFESAPSNIVSYTFGFPAVIAINTTATALSLTWSTVTNALSYNVLRGTTSGGPYTLLANVATSPYSNTTAAPVANPAVAGTGYYYVVQPVFAGATVGEYSNQVSGMLSGVFTPTGLTVIGTTNSSVSLRWPTINSAGGYTVYKATNSAGPYTTAGNVSRGNITSYTVNALLPNTHYYFKVATSSCGTGCQSSFTSAYTYSAPSAPSVSVGNSSLQIQWTAIGGATSYNVLRSTDGINFTNIQSGATGGAYTDTTVVNGNIYFYEIQAVYPGGSLNSASSNGITPGVTPLTPNGLTVIDNSTGTDIGLNWAAVSGATTYSVYLSTTSGGPWGTSVLGSSSTTDNYLTGLTPGTTYYAVVTALNGTMESGYSSEIAFIPSLQSSAPTALLAGTSVDVNWGALGGAISYDVYRSVNSVDFSPLATGLVVTTYTDSTVVAAKTYYYKILPHGAGGNLMAFSAVSLPVTIVDPPSPTTLVAEAPNTGTVNLSWVVAYSPQVSTYNIYRGNASGGPYTKIGTRGFAVNQYPDGTVVSGNTYYYVMTAVNIFGGESAYSNEVGVSLTAGPATLTAMTASNKISLTWATTAGATGYLIRRSLQSAGPYGSLATLGVATNYQDDKILNGVTYYYVVDAILAGGVLSVDSPEASVAAVLVMNLQVPIELTDQAMSSDTVATTFERTQTSLDPTAYDGTVTYKIETVAINTDSVGANFSVVDSGGVVRGSLVIPAGTHSPTRMSAVFTPNVLADNYRVQLSSTTNAGQLQVYSARILITQVGASKTKVYIPLLSSANSPSLGDLYSPTESSSNSGYAVLNSSTIFKRDPSRFVQLIEYNPWQFEALVSSNGGRGLIGLYNRTTSGIVESSEIEFNSSNVTMVKADFGDGVANFSSPANDLNQYQVAMQCSGNCDLGSVSVYKAGLWVSLTNLEKVEVIFRNGLANNNINSLLDIDNERTMVDLSKFSNPVVNFRAVANPQNMTVASVQLMTAGSGGGSDSGTGSISGVTDSSLNFLTGGLQLVETSSPVTLNSLDRYLVEVNSTGGGIKLQDASIIIETSP